MINDKPEKPVKKTITAQGQTSARPKKEDLFPVEALAETNGLLSWEKAGLMAAAGWAQGKQVSETQFQSALNTFRNRPQGGGRI